jgi:hypothetical protein
MGFAFGYQACDRTKNASSRGPTLRLLFTRAVCNAINFAIFAIFRAISFILRIKTSFHV